MHGLKDLAPAQLAIQAARIVVAALDKKHGALYAKRGEILHRALNERRCEASLAVLGQHADRADIAHTFAARDVYSGTSGANLLARCPVDDEEVAVSAGPRLGELSGDLRSRGRFPECLAHQLGPTLCVPFDIFDGSEIIAIGGLCAGLCT